MYVSFSGKPDKFYICTDNKTKKNCLTESTLKFNLLEMCAFSFLYFHLIRLSPNNTWPDTANKVKTIVCTCIKPAILNGF